MFILFKSSYTYICTLYISICSLEMSPAKVNQVLVGHTSDVTSCDCFGDLLASCSGDKSIKLWLQDSKGIFSEVEFSPLVEHTYGVNCVRFSPFGTLLASCSTDGKVILWNVQVSKPSKCTIVLNLCLSYNYLYFKYKIIFCVKN